MAKYSNVVEYSIITDVDTSGVTKLQNELTKLKQSLKNEPKSFNRLGLNPEDIDKSIQKINQLQTALTKAFNAKIGTLDLSKLNASLQQEHSSLQMIARDWEQMGSRGKVAISSLSSALLSMNSNAVTINTTLSKMANTFGNTVRWGITAGIFQEMVSSVQGAVSYMKDLDESLTQIQMVTNSSKENMRELAQYANQAAQALGSTTVDYTNAVKVFVQEGFSEAESKQYANLSTKLANVSEQDTATTSDQITAYRNAFQLDYQQTVEAMDKVANVANNTASNVNELMTASQRSASVAQAVGATQDSFLASLATIQSVTRQTAEEIGNGMKTIYQRLADIRLGGETEDGVDYGKYANTLKQVGVDVLDAAGEFKGMDEIFKELMAAWKDMSRTQQIAVGETVAGKFQYNRFAALMNNADYYEKSLNATQDASGMMDQMNDYYMESIEGRLKTLQAAGEEVMSTLFNQDAVEPMIEDVTKLVNGLNDLVDAAGGLNGVLTALSGIMLRTFSTQIAGTINNIASSFGLMIANTNNAKNFSNVAASLGLIGSSSQNGSLGQKLVSGVADNYDSLSIKSKEKLEQISKQIVVLDETRLQLTQKQRAALQPIISTATKEMQLRQESGAALKQEINDLQKKYSAGKISTATYNEQLKLLQDEKKTLEQQTSQYAQAEQAAAKLTQALENGETNISDQVQKVKELARELRVAGFDAAELDRLIEQAEIAANNESNLGSAVDDALGTTSLESKINNVTKLIGSVTSLAFGFSMVSEAIKVCTDDSATLEEKISAVVMNGLMGITMAVPGIMDAAKAIRGLRAAHIAAASGAAIETAAETAGNAARTTRNVLDAQWLLMKAPYIAAAAAIALAIAGIVLVIKNMTDEAAQANREFERQKDILADVKKSASDAGEELESLHRSIESIGDAQKSLEGMAKGTDEWREATRKLNKEILTLLETYPELAQYVHSADGVLSIDQEGLDKFYSSQVQEAAHLQNMASGQQIVTLSAENDKLIADFARKWEVSSETLRNALDNNQVRLAGKSDELNSAFAELSNQVNTNNITMSTLNDTIGTLGNFENYATEKDTENAISEAEKALREKYGRTVTHGSARDGTAYEEQVVNLSNFANDTDLLKDISEAIGEKVISGKDLSWFDDQLEVTLSNGEKIAYTSEELLQILSDSKGIAEIEKQVLEENKMIYEAFGAKFQESTQQFVDSTGNVITSLDDIKNISEDQKAAIKAFRDGIYNDLASKEFSGTLQEFIQELANCTLTVDGFSESLSNYQYEQQMAGYQNQLSQALYNSNVLDVQAEMAATRFNNAGTAGIPTDPRTALQSSMVGMIGEGLIDQALADTLVKDMMDKLNNSSLSDSDKLSLMDKIDWNLPIQDILANIQRAIDTGDIGQAFLDTSALEDDSERREKVLKENDIDELTFDTYKEQLEQTDELAERKQYLVDTLNETRAAFGDESEEAKTAKEDLESFADEVDDLAVDLIQTQKGLTDLSNAFAENGDILREGDKSSLEYAAALSDVRQALADVLNISPESISAQFIQDNLAEIERLAMGDIDALNELRAAAGQEIAMNLYMQGNLTPENLQYLQDKAFELASVDINMGASVDDTEFVNTLNSMLENGQLTKDQVNEYLNAIGYEAHYSEKEVPTEIFSTRGMYLEIPSPFPGADPIRFDFPEFSIHGITKVPQISAESSGSSGGGGGRLSSSGSGLTRKAAGFSGGGGGISPSYVNKAFQPSGSGSGGSGKSSTPKETTPKEVKPKEYATSEWDYLTDITNDLERAAAAMEKLTKLEDRLFGASRISNLQKLKQEYAGYISLLQQEVSLAKSHANRLRTQAYDENGNLTMNAYAGNAGIGYLHFDSKGNLENGREIELALLNKLNDATAAYNANRYDENTSSWYSDRVDDAKKNYDGFMKAMQEYQDTLGKIEEGENQIQEYQQKIQDAADEIIDSIQEGIEGIIEAIDSQRDWDRMYRNWMEGGNGYSHFASDQKYYEEGLESLFSKTIGGNKSVIDLQLENLQNRIGDVKNVFDGDSSNADKEKLSEQAAQENLREAIDNLTDNIEKAVDYYDSLIETIEEASSKMDELIDSRLGEYDSIYDYLDTRLDQYKMLNSQEYAGQAQLYGKQIETNLQKLVDINTSIEAKQATVKSLEKLEASGKTLSTEEREALKEAREKVNALQKDQLETESKILSTVKNKLEAETRQSVKELQNAIMGGEDFEWAKQQWELASKMSSRYLDDYNRAYEVQKIQLQYQQLLNSTQETELATRQKITAEMNNQLKYLREKESLSAYDIQRAQGELELLQRKIALEEAYNNKSQMQLQRNAAGNYDFVYTADEDNVLSAMQALMEKEQELYNLSKSRQEELRQDFYDFVTEMGEMIIETATNMDIAAEERDIRVKEMLNSLSEYMITIDEETTMAQVDLYNSFVDASEIITEENVGKLQDVFDRMAEATAAIKEAIGSDLDGIQQHHSDTSDAIDQRTEDGFIKIQSGSNSTKSVLTDDLNKILENFDGTFNSIDATTSNSFANISNNMNSAYESVRKTSKDKLAKIDADTKLHMDSADTKIREVVTNVSTTIDEKTEHIKTKSIASTEEVQKAIDKASTDISTSVKNAERDTKEALKAAGDSFNTFIKSSINNATLRLAVLDASTRTFASDLRTLNSVISSCSSQISTWRNAISNAMYQANSFISSGNSLMQSLYNIGVQAGYATSDFYDLANAIQYAAACMADLNGMSYSSPSYSSYDYGGGGYGGGGGYSQEAYDAAYRIWMYGDPGGGGYWYDQGVSMYGQSLADEILSLFNSGYGYEWMDTGGYTGTWNVGESLRQSGGGKLAVLHQKELVLNPEDTENMLSAVSVVRDIVSGLNNVTKVPSSNLNRQSPIGDNIEQRVSINATFPGVSEAIEIKQALEQLADDAYQVANQYKY